MSTEKKVTKKAEGSALAQSQNDVADFKVEDAVKTGLKQPYAKVLLRLMLAVLVIVALTLFLSSILKYDSLMREKTELEKEKDELTLEVEELKYLIDCPVDYDYIVRVAREKLNLHLPDEIVYYNDYNE